MPRSLLLLVILFQSIVFLCNCSTPEPPQSSIQLASEEFRPYVKEAMKACPNNVSSISIGFIEAIDGGYIGLCHPRTGTIRIERKFWLSASVQARRALILHELGHCWLSLPHAEERNSFMYPYLYVAEDNLEQYKEACGR